MAEQNGVTRGQEKENEQFWCLTGWLGLTRTDNCTMPAFHVDREESCQSATHRVHQKLALEFRWPGGLSPKEFFGLHCQVPVQLCSCIVGHLTDLQKYKIRQPDNWGWRRGQIFQNYEKVIWKIIMVTKAQID